MKVLKYVALCALLGVALYYLLDLPWHRVSTGETSPEQRD